MKLNFTSKERAALRSQAQELSPVVMVGHEGVTDSVVAALNEAMACHGLVKVRFQDFKENVRDLSLELEQRTDSNLIATTGFTAVFFNPVDEDRKKKK